MMARARGRKGSRIGEETRTELPWKKAPPEMVSLFERVRPPEEAGVQHRSMFGYPCCFVVGHMFMGLHEDNLFLRLSEEDIEAFLRIPGASRFEPMAGRPMRGYVTVPREMLADGPDLHGWIERSLAFARQLPPKQESKRKPQRGR